MLGLSTPELIIILVIALLLFGHKLPSMMRGLGSSVKEFKKGMDSPDEVHAPVQAAPPAAAQPPAGAIARDASAPTPPKA